MKNILFFAALVALFSMAFPAMMLVKYEEGKPGHCFSNLTGAMSNGETKDIPGKCMKGDCGEDRTLHISTCISIGKVAATAYNYDEPYPNCCPFPTKGN